MGRPVAVQGSCASCTGGWPITDRHSDHLEDLDTPWPVSKIDAMLVIPGWVGRVISTPSEYPWAMDKGMYKYKSEIPLVVLIQREIRLLNRTPDVHITHHLHPFAPGASS